MEFTGQSQPNRMFMSTDWESCSGYFARGEKEIRVVQKMQPTGEECHGMAPPTLDAD